MKKQIVINASKDRSRIAIVEDGELVELYIETPDNVRSIGNVYLAEIQKVMPALRAAFVDVGQKQDCFLHFSDLTDNLPQLLALAGEDVPGLDEPVLSLAPPKRVADDENEPDVEESLEIEPAPEESRSRRTSRRRSRGRGRGRGRGQGHGGREEEEEQEEKPRRALPSVIDLTAPAKPRRKPEPKPEPTPEPVDEASEPAAEADASSDGAAAPVEEAAPTKKRTRSRKVAEPTPDSEDVPVEESAPEAEADSDADSQASDEADASEPPKKRRRRGRRGRGKGADDASNEDSTNEPDTAEPTADPTSGSDSEESETTQDKAPAKPRRSRSRKKSTADASTEADDAAPESDDEAEAPKAKSSGRGRKSLPATLDLTSSAKPKRSRSTESDDSGDETGRSRRGAKSGPSPKMGPSGDASSSRGTRSDDDGSDKPSRSRRSTRSSDDAKSGGDESSPRGFKKPNRAPDESSDASGDSPQGDASAKKDTSRRRSGRGRKAPDTATDAPETKDESSSDESKGRGRGRGRGGRSEGGRGRSSDESSSKESSRSESGKDSSDSDGRSGRGRSDRSGNGRSGGRSSDSRSSGRNGGGRDGRSSNRNSIPSNENLLKRGGRIIVKITKEAISNKGPRVSTDLSLAGRFLVLVPAADYVAVSKKIESAKERRRLRTLATNLKPDGFGVIVRTVAEGRDAKSLDTDLRLLADKWRKIQNKLDEKPNPPVLLYQDVNMVSSVIRDLFSEDYDRILVDDEKVFRNVHAYVKAVAPQMADKVELHKGRGQVYRSLGIEKQVEEAFSKRVNMKSGGYLFIETTEAMHVVDVNSGRAGRGKSQKQNLIDVNVEAAKEIAKQLRLRDLGGIIVVDFIDLKYDRDRRKVTDALKQSFEKDRAVTKLLPMSDFGLVQITRQRLRPSITANAVDEDGEPLDGIDAMEASGASEIVHPGKSMDVGIEPDSLLSNRDEPQDSRRDDRRGDRSQSRRPSRAAVSPEAATPQALAGKLRGWLEHYRQTVGEKYRGRPIVVRVHPLFDDYLKRGFVPQVTRWRLSSLRGITFRVESDASIDPTGFDVRDQKSGRSLLKKYDA